MKNKISLVIVLIVMLLNVCSCIKSNESAFLKDYPLLKDENHVFVVSTADEIIEVLNSKDKAIIMFAFPECPWCQAAIPYVNEIAKEQNIQKVYYLNILDMRENEESVDHQKYLQIFEEIRFDIGNPDKINAPTVITVKNGEVLGYHIDTVLSHVKNDNNVLEPMNEDQIEELKNIYRELFSLN